jgi:hypothetical protein
MEQAVGVVCVQPGQFSNNPPVDGVHAATLPFVNVNVEWTAQVAHRWNLPHVMPRVPPC